MNKSNFSNIETKTSSLKNIFNKKIIYSCPLFQRKYVWEITQWEELWEDILSIISDNSEDQNIIYLGAIILKNQDSDPSQNFYKSLIIDGQQRLTTLYVILCALSKLFSENGKSTNGKNIITQYLATKEEEEEVIYAKILPTIEDQQYFNKMLTNLEFPVSNLYQIEDNKETDNRINSAFNYFEKAIKKYAKYETSATQLDMDKIQNLQKFILEKLFFICIQIENKFIDENKIYEKLNTSGKQLEIIDYIRNKIFSNLNSQSYNEMENLYNNQWTKFENSFGGNSAKHSKIRNQYFFNFGMIISPNIKEKDTFYTLKNRWDDLNIESSSPLQMSKTIIKDLSEYHLPYLILREINNFPDFVDAEIKSCLSNLFKVGLPLGTLPYTMKLLKNIINDIEQQNVGNHINILQIIEKYFVRRGIVNDDSTGIHQFFKSLWNRCQANPQHLHDLLIGSSSTSGISMPTDDRVLSSIKELTPHKDTAKYVLSEYEVYLTSRIHRNQIEPNYNKATIEHICPQDLGQSTWNDIFTEMEHDRTNNLIGNWILLTKSRNSSLGNRPWADKKRYYSEVENIFHGPKEVSGNDNWTPDEIDSRTLNIGKFITEEWKL